jgi:tetratricopeptide (TPR) repeat protein
MTRRILGIGSAPNCSSRGTDHRHFPTIGPRNDAKTIQYETTLKRRKASARAAANPEVSGSGSPPVLRWWPYWLLIAVAAGVYANALANGFVSDDNSQLLGNPLVTDWRQIPQIFLHNNWAFAGQTTSNYYRPVQTLVYLCVYYVFGFEAFAFHLVLLLLHVGNTVLVFKLGGRLLKSQYPALVAAVLFAVHPIHSEAVVWIAALPDVILTTVVLAALLAFVRWDAAPRPGQIAALASLFFLALLCKEPGAMLLPMLAGYEFLYLGRSLWPRPASGPTLRDNAALYASLLGVFAGYALLRIHALGGLAPSQGGYRDLHGTTMILSVIATLGQYLGMLIAPVHLNFFHIFEASTSITPVVAVSLTVELGLVAAIFLLRRRSPLVAYGLFCILIPLTPALNLNGVGENALAERYLYLPSVGFVLVAAVAWEWVAAKKHLVAWSVVAVIVAVSAWDLFSRNRDWHDDLRLFTVSVEASPQSATLLGNLGGLYAQRGEYDAAIEKYLQALRFAQLRPQLALLHNNLGSAYAHQGRYQDAVAELRQAIGLSPASAEAHLNLGVALEAEGDIPGAVAEQQAALQINPNYGDAYNALALLRMKDKDYPAAIDLLQHAVALNPRHTEAYINLGVACNGAHRYADAAAALRKAIEVGPNDPSIYVAHYDLGVSYSRLNSLDAAALEFSKSLQLRPDYQAARDSLMQVQNMLHQSGK